MANIVREKCKHECFAFTQADLPPESFHYLLSRPWGQVGCQKKQKSSKVSTAVFQPILNKLWKTRQKRLFFHGFWSFWKVFQALFNFGWKTAQFDNKFKFLDPFCFFCHPNQSQVRICKEDMTDFMFLFGIFLLWHHLAISNFFSK